MGILAVVQRGIDQAVRMAGDAMVAVLVARAQEVQQVPGEDYEPSWSVISGRGFWEKVEAEDFPGTEVQVDDRVLALIQCSRDIDSHDYVNVEDEVYKVFGVKSALVGSTRVLQKLLVRTERRSGIEWVSSDLTAV